VEEPAACEQWENLGDLTVSVQSRPAGGARTSKFYAFGACSGKSNS
jgi:hypothetical protein